MGWDRKTVFKPGNSIKLTRAYHNNNNINLSFSKATYKETRINKQNKREGILA